MEWLAAGYTPESIAKEIGATPRRIQAHIRNLKAKTDAGTRVETVGMAHGKGVRPLDAAA